MGRETISVDMAAVPIMSATHGLERQDGSDIQIISPVKEGLLWTHCGPKPWNLATTASSLLSASLEPLSAVSKDPRLKLGEGSCTA